MTDQELVAEARRLGSVMLTRPGDLDRYIGGVLKEIADRFEERVTAPLPA